MLTVLASEQFFISKSNHINIWTINWIDDHLKIISSEVASQAILPLWSDKKSLEVTVELKTLVKLGYFQSDPASPEFSTRQGEAENSINPVKAVQCIPNNLRNCHLSWFTWLSPSTGPLPGSGSRNNDQRSRIKDQDQSDQHWPRLIKTKPMQAKKHPNNNSLHLSD